MKWLPKVGQIVSAQLLVQLINAVTGFLIVRSLAKSEYAWFTIINTVAAIFANLGDSGLAAGLLASGGRVWQDRVRFSSLVATALRLRMVIGAIAALGAVPWAFWMLAKNNAPVGLSVLLIAASLAGVLPAAEVVVLGIVPRLRSEVHIQQLSDLLVAALRLALSAAAMLFFPVTLPLVIVVAISQWAQLFYMRSHVARVVDFRVDSSLEFRAELLQMVKSLWFPIFFNCIQALTGTFLLSIFGSTDAVAGLGALTRFGVAFSVGGAVVHHLVAPAFARSQSPRALGGLVLRGGLLLAACCGGLTGIAWLFPDALLWVIGSGYSGLHRELLLLFAYHSMASVLMFTWSLNSSRGWVGLSWLSPMLTLMGQIVLLKFLNVSTLEGTLWFMICSQFPPLLVHIFITWRGVRAWPSSLHPA